MRVFVYGTLKRGHGNNRLLNDSKFLGEAYTPGMFTLLDLGPYPAVVPVGTTKVKGEVWEVDEVTMTRLDWLEGYPHHYDRKEIDTAFGKSWIYFYHPTEEGTIHARVVESGEWK